jgi:hypothetical protein
VHVFSSKRRVLRGLIAGVLLAGSVSIAAVALAGRGARQQHQRTLATRFVHASPLSRYRPSVRARVVAGSAVDRSAAAETVRDLGPANRILQIEFTTPPAAFNLPANAVWANVDVAAPDRPGAAFSIWQAFLAVSAIADANRSSGAAPLAGKSVRLIFPDGETADAGQSVNELVPAGSDVPPAAAQALSAGIAAEARQEHLKITEEGSFDIAGRPAVFATVVTSDPYRFGRETSARMFALQRGVLNAPFAAAGSFIEVRDSAGGVVEIGGSASRLQQGVGWSNPAFGPPSGLLAH